MRSQLYTCTVYGKLSIADYATVQIELGEIDFFGLLTKIMNNQKSLLSITHGPHSHLCHFDLNLINLTIRQSRIATPCISETSV